MRKVLGLNLTLVAVLALGVGCVVHQNEAPPLTGPSEFALALRLTANPDSISQDGASQAKITIAASDENGKPKSGVVIRLAMEVGGVPQDFGTLNAKNPDGNDGTSSTVFTSPPPAPALVPAARRTVVTPCRDGNGTNTQASVPASASTHQLRLSFGDGQPRRRVSTSATRS